MSQKGQIIQKFIYDTHDGQLMSTTIMGDYIGSCQERVRLDEIPFQRNPKRRMTDKYDAIDHARALLIVDWEERNNPDGRSLIPLLPRVRR